MNSSLSSQRPIQTHTHSLTLTAAPRCLSPRKLKLNVFSGLRLREQRHFSIPCVVQEPPGCDCPCEALGVTAGGRRGSTTIIEMLRRRPQLHPLFRPCCCGRGPGPPGDPPEDPPPEGEAPPPQGEARLHAHRGSLALLQVPPSCWDSRRHSDPSADPREGGGEAGERRQHHANPPRRTHYCLACMALLLKPRGGGGAGGGAGGGVGGRPHAHRSRSPSPAGRASLDSSDLSSLHKSLQHIICRKPAGSAHLKVPAHSEPGPAHREPVAHANEDGQASRPQCPAENPHAHMVCVGEGACFAPGPRPLSPAPPVERPRCAEGDARQSNAWSVLS